MEIENKHLYHRKNPIRDFDPNQTIYTLVTSENQDNLSSDMIGYLGFNHTYEEVFNSANKAADAYHKYGIKEGDTIAISTIGSPLVNESLLAINKLGATSKWIDLRVKEKEFIKSLNESGIKILVTFDGILPLIERIIDETKIEKVLVSSPKDYLPPLAHFIADLKDKKEGKYIGLPKDSRFMKYREFLKEGSMFSLLEAAPYDKNRIAVNVSSSGSTGPAKSILHTDYNFNVIPQRLSYTDLPLYRGNTMHISVPPFVIYGLDNSYLTAMIHGMKSEITPFVDENTVYNDLGKFDISFGAPLHYRYMYKKIKELYEKIEKLENISDDPIKYLAVEFQEKESEILKEFEKFIEEKESGYDITDINTIRKIALKLQKQLIKELDRVLKGISRVKVFVSGGDKLSPEEIIDMMQLFEKIIINGYGNNEVVGAAVVSVTYANRPGSIGIPLPGVEAIVVDSNTNKQLKNGQLGELCLHSDSLFVRYEGDKEATKEVKQLHEDGKEYVHTGDLAIIDSEGFIYPKGRNKRLIKRAAFKISPDSIENVISSIPNVRTCVVVGAPDEKELEVPMAFIEFDENVDEENMIEEVKRICNEEIPDYKIPVYFKSRVIPYKNNKQDVLLLESEASEYVQNLKAPQMILK
ncbi:MAG: acyl--CoA ligase [Bacilli bacterium]|nr:acyl--CoA ligase [Bacilli bacterium]